MRTRLTPTSLMIKMTVRLFRPVAEEDRLRLVATGDGWRVRGPLHARDFDFACEGRWAGGADSGRCCSRLAPLLQGARATVPAGAPQGATAAVDTCT